MSLLLLAAALGALASPIQAEHPRSRQAREHLAAKESGPALEAYRALEAEVGPRPELEVGRGAALLSGGRDAEAAEAFGKAREAPEPLGSRALLGLGTALAGKGELDGAIAAYREALRRDPGYSEARQDLEVALRRKAEEARERRQEQPPGQPPPERSPEPTGGQPQPRQDPGGQAPQGRPPQPGPGGPPEPAPGEKPSRDEALRLLDAMRAREQNLPEGPQRRAARRGDAEKDW